MDVGTSKASATWLNPGPLKWPILQLDGQRGRRELLFFRPGWENSPLPGEVSWEGAADPPEWPEEWWKERSPAVFCLLC